MMTSNLFGIREISYYKTNHCIATDSLKKNINIKT